MRDLEFFVAFSVAVLVSFNVQTAIGSVIPVKNEENSTNLDVKAAATNKTEVENVPTLDSTTSTVPTNSESVLTKKSSPPTKLRDIMRTWIGRRPVIRRPLWWSGKSYIYKSVFNKTDWSTLIS